MSQVLANSGEATGSNSNITATTTTSATTTTTTSTASTLAGDTNNVVATATAAATAAAAAASVAATAVASRVESPMKQLKFYLDKYKIKDALQIFFTESTLKLLAEEPDFMWDVIPLVCTRLRGLCQYRFRVFEGCERMLCRLAEDDHCNPKEVLIGLLAEINQTEHKEDDNVFRAMIRPLEGALLRMAMPSPREENFRWTLNVLMRHIDDTPLPQEYNIEGKKRLSLPNDPSVKRFIETLPLMLSFIEELNEKPVPDYDKSPPMPLLTESQIDEVLNGGDLSGVDLGRYADNDDDVDCDELDDELEDACEQHGHHHNHHHHHIGRALCDKIQDNDDHREREDEEEDDDDDDFMSDDHAPARSDITDASITALLHLVQRPFTTLDTTNYCKELRSTSVRCLCLLLRLMPDLMAPIYKQSKTARLYTSSGRLPPPPPQAPALATTPLGTTESAETTSDTTAAAAAANTNTSNTTNTNTTRLLDDAADIISSNLAPLASQHFEGSLSEAMMALATCAYLYRCEVKTCPSPALSPSSSAMAVSSMVGPTMPTTPLAIDMTQYFPQILTHDALFFCHVPYIVVLLKRPELLAHEKGLSLLGNLLSLLTINSKDMQMLELCKSSSLLSELFHLMIHSPLSTNRRRAYELFTVICDLLAYDAKHDLFKWVLAQSDLRPCIRAACVDQYRRQLSNIHKELAELHQRVTFVKSLSDSEPHPSEVAARAAAAAAQKPMLGNGEQMKLINELLDRLTYSEDPTQNPYDIGCDEFTMESMREFRTIEHQIDTRHENIWIMCRESLRRIHIWQGRHKILAGRQLTEFLDMAIAACLPEGQHTDLIENNDLILATLTMFRYLKLRKPLVKDDLERDYLANKKLRKRFFNPIRNALALVKAELKTHLRELENQKQLVEHQQQQQQQNSSGGGDKAESSNETPVKTSKQNNSTAAGGQVKPNQTPNQAKRRAPIPNSSIPIGAAVGGTKHQNTIPNNHQGPLDDLDDEDDEEDDLLGQLGGFGLGGAERPDGDAECLNFVLCRLDLVESVLVRTCDLFDC